MGQISNKYDINEDLEQGDKTLPNDFGHSEDGISFKKALALSAVLHPTIFGALWLTVFILTLLGINLFAFDKPPMKPMDMNFVIVTKEAPPIDKNTKNRSTMDSRAGGKHDPTRQVSTPSAPAAPKKVQTPAAPKKVENKAPAPIQNMFKPKTTPAPTPTPTPAPPAPAKPQALNAPKPTAPTVARPSDNMPRPQMPKLTQNPKSPFSVEVPKNNGPVGSAPSSGTGTASSGGSSASGGSSGSKGSGMPSPQFSASKSTGGSSGGSSSSGGSRGSSGGGSGNYGNPGPGNPAGAPGVDAIRQPDWGPYMRELERRIKRNWAPPKGETSKRVVVDFKIARDGKLLAVSIAKSSGQPLADQAALSAVQQTAPFSPLPPECKDPSINISFTFDYNVVGANYR